MLAYVRGCHALGQDTIEDRVVMRKGIEVHLTPTEYKLLTTLIRHAGKVITHRQLLKEVWGRNSINHTPYLRVYNAQLRHKLEDDPALSTFPLVVAFQ